ncbi:lipase [Legionella busanensis]|uniref:Lipase n=1 Tax=Legionella busanensis TaxID=190655 RepID=A0A378JRN2_9GAMM|nr:alpha/beta hydrolase [Legionella busanensis]STX52829.1 lipase [Legionella busanensis]
MKHEDLRCIYMGKQLYTVNSEDLDIIAPKKLNNRKSRSALLLLHGFSSTPGVYRFLLPHIKDFYDSLIIPALPGHVESIQAFSQIKDSELLQFAEQTCASLVEKYQYVDVLGLSLGGLIGCHLSNKFDLRHLYLLAPALDLTLNITKTMWLIQFLQALGFRNIRSAAGNIYLSLAQEKVYQQMTVKRGFNLDEFKGGEIAYRQIPLAASLTILTLIKEFQFIIPKCPTDLFLGAHDKVVNSQQVAKRFANQAHIKTHWLPNSAHVLPLDNDIEVIIQSIKTNFQPLQSKK